MPRIRLRSFVTIAPAIGSVHLRSDLRSVQIDTPHVGTLAIEILPLLDGTRDKQEVSAAVKGYSRRSVMVLLDRLERCGLLETASDHVEKPLDGADVDQQALRHLLTSCIDSPSGIIAYLTSEPPDWAKLNVAWTSTAVLDRSKFGPQTSSKMTGFGVGLNAIEAMGKAAAEGLELYAAGHPLQSDLFCSSLAGLKEDCLDPRQLCLYEPEQYLQRDFPYTRFDRRKPICWTRGQWLDTGKSVWLPAPLTYFGADLPADQQFAQVTTSGLATGTSVEDASMRAICELVERDAFMMTWLCRLPARQLVPDAGFEAGGLGIVRELETQGLDVRFYLLTSEIDIPVVLCLVLGNGKDWPAATIGLGAHYDVAVAARKAVLEQALMGPALRREMLSEKRRIPKRPQDVITPLDHALYYIPKKRARAFDFLERKEIPSVLLSDLRRTRKPSLTGCVELLRAVGARVAIKDLTPTNLVSKNPFCVVRALATRLQPIHFGFDLTRLGSPRLKRLMKGPINPHPHPLA